MARAPIAAAYDRSCAAFSLISTHRDARAFAREGARRSPPRESGAVRADACAEAANLRRQGAWASPSTVRSMASRPLSSRAGGASIASNVMSLRSATSFGSASIFIPRRVGPASRNSLPRLLHSTSPLWSASTQSTRPRSRCGRGFADRGFRRAGCGTRPAGGPARSRRRKRRSSKRGCFGSSSTRAMISGCSNGRPSPDRAVARPHTARWTKRQPDSTMRACSTSHSGTGEWPSKACTRKRRGSVKSSISWNWSMP